MWRSWDLPRTCSKRIFRYLSSSGNDRHSSVGCRIISFIRIEIAAWRLRAGCSKVCCLKWQHPVCFITSLKLSSWPVFPSVLVSLATNNLFRIHQFSRATSSSVLEESKECRSQQAVVVVYEFPISSVWLDLVSLFLFSLADCDRKLYYYKIDVTCMEYIRSRINSFMEGVFPRVQLTSCDCHWWRRLATVRVYWEYIFRSIS